MKLKNIFPIVCFLFAAVSCSMEDEIINDITRAENNASTKNEAYIALTADVISGALTKAEPLQNANPAEAAIDHLTIILLDGNGKVIKAIDDVYANADKVVVTAKNSADTIKFLVKTETDYQLMAIANSEIKFGNSTNMVKYNTLSAINKAIQGEGENATTVAEAATLNYLIKVGSVAVNIAKADNDPRQSASTDISKLIPYIYTIPLTQLTARIELAEFNVKGFTAGTVPQDIKITKVELANINTVSYTDLAGQTPAVSNYVDAENTNSTNGWAVYTALNAGFIPTEPGSQKYNGATKYSLATNNNMPVFYSFRNVTNDSDSKTVMRIHFLLGNQERISRDIVISSGKIEAGYLYRIIVDSNIDNNNIEVSVRCYVKDWTKTSLSIDMEEI